MSLAPGSGQSRADARSEAHIEFDEAYFSRLRKWDDFWWHRSIRYLIERLALTSFPGLRFDTVADIGCGTGAVLRHLAETLRPRRIVGMDFAQAGLVLARRDFGQTNVFRGSIFELPLRSAELDLVTCLSVLHHLPSGSDDRQAMAELRRILRPGGGLILTSSSAGWWNPLRKDDPQENYHPYTLEEMARKLEGVGFRVIRATCFNAVLLPAEWAKRFLSFKAKLVRQDRGLEHGLHHHGTPAWIKLADTVQYRLLQTEAALLTAPLLGRHLRLPAGLQAVCTAVRP